MKSLRFLESLVFWSAFCSLVDLTRLVMFLKAQKLAISYIVKQNEAVLMLMNRRVAVREIIVNLGNFQPRKN